MHKGLNRTGFIVCGIMGALLTIVISKVFTNRQEYLTFPLKLEIDPFQIVSLVVTVWLAYFIKEVLDRKSERRLSISTLVSNRIDKVVGELNAFQKEIDNLTARNTQANSLSKTLTAHRNIITSFISNDDRFEDLDKTAFETDFNNHVRSIRDLLTNTPATTVPGVAPDISSSAGVYTYSESRVDLIRQDMLRLESLLTRLQHDFFRKD